MKKHYLSFEEDRCSCHAKEIITIPCLQFNKSFNNAKTRAKVNDMDKLLAEKTALLFALVANEVNQLQKCKQ